MHALVVLIAVSLSAAGDRVFVVNAPYSKCIKKLQDEAGKVVPMRPPVGVKILALNAKEDTKNRRLLWLTGHLAVTNAQIGEMNLKLIGSVQEWDHATVLHAYTTQPSGLMSYARIYVILSDAGNKTTRVQLHVELKPGTPKLYRRSGRPRWFVNMLLRTPKGQMIIEGYAYSGVQQALSQAVTEIHKVLK